MADRINRLITNRHNWYVFWRYLTLNWSRSKSDSLRNQWEGGLQIATDDVVPNYVIGEADARAVATSNIVPLLVPCALTLVVVEPGCYGWTRPRTKLSEDTPEPAPVSGELRDTRHPWRARTWTWTLSSCRSSAAWAPRTKTSSFRSFRDC